MIRLVSRHAAIAVVLLCALLLLTWRLGAVYLWQDEAQTAVLAERMLRYGKPLAYDGRNVITMDSLADEDSSSIDQRTGDADAALRYLVGRGDFRPDTTWVGHPWGQFVVAGLSLAVLGHGTWQARLPFALAALATVLLLYVLALRVFADRTVAVLAAALLVANAYWVLHSRQCRYYALSSLALLLSVAAFLRWQRGARWGGPLFVLAGWTYFQCDFGSFFPAMGVLAAVAGAASWPRIGRPAVVFAVLGGTVAPFAWYYGIHARLRNPASSLEARLAGIVLNANEYVVGLPILALAGWLLWLGRKELTPEQRRLLSVAIAVIVVTTLWVPLVAPASFHRYLVHLTPLGALLSAWTVVRIADALARIAGQPWARGGVAVLAVVLLGATSVASRPLAFALTRHLPLGTGLLRAELGFMARSVFEDRADPNRLTIEWVRSRLQPGDEVLVNYEDLPFVFYTDARVRGGIAAFRAEDRSGPPRFLVLRRSVDFVHWPVFLRQFRRHPWRLVATGAPDVPFGNNPDPAFAQAPARNREIVVAELAR